jgi:Tol biopolymer transport system component
LTCCEGGLADQKAERVTSDEWNDWFPHPSPDGKWIVFVSFAKGTMGHPANKGAKLGPVAPVYLRQLQDP